MPPNSKYPEANELCPVPPLGTPNIPLVIALASNVVAPPVNIVPFLRNCPVILTSPITSNGYAGVVVTPIPTFPLRYDVPLQTFIPPSVIICPDT